MLDAAQAPSRWRLHRWVVRWWEWTHPSPTWREHAAAGLAGRGEVPLDNCVLHRHRVPHFARPVRGVVPAARLGVRERDLVVDQQLHELLVGLDQAVLGAAVEVNGTTYAFLDATQELATLNLSTGSTTVIGPFDGAAGVISAAVPTPEPATMAIAALGLAVLAGCGWIRSRLVMQSGAEG